MNRNNLTKNLLAGLLSLLLLLGVSACNDNDNDSVATPQDTQDTGGTTGEAASETASRSNILLIVADDMGYSDIGPFGGEIRTPTLDSLADSGITMTNFHANPSCSPTRAALMSGTDTHVAGMGVMFEMIAGHAISDEQAGAPGYEGYLLEGMDTLPQKLQEAGYHTYMAGKWHLANLMGNLMATIPAARGFEKSFALVPGGASHYGDGLAAMPSGVPTGLNPGDDGFTTLFKQYALYVEDMHPGVQVPTDFYSTTFYTDKLIEYIDGQGDDEPFFAYAAYTAPHWPLQLPLEAMEEGNEWNEKFNAYEKIYAAGYDFWREQRLANMKRLGIISRDTEPNSWDEYGGGEGIPAWNSLSSDEQKTKAREMAVYAVMVEYMDYQIGRLLEHVDQDNTIVVFMSDNGAEATVPTQYWPPIPASQEEYVGLLQAAAGTPDYNGYENLGRPGSYLAYDAGWTQVSALPHRGYKIMTTEGGIRVPMIVKAPGTASSGTLSDAFGHVMDLMPTFLEVAGVAEEDYPQQDLRGSSMAPFLSGTGGTIHDAEYGIGWELLGARAYVENDYKLFMQAPKFGGDVTWELYDLVSDQAENHNLIDDPDYSDLAQDLLDGYDDYAWETGVVEYPTPVEP